MEVKESIHKCSMRKSIKISVGEKFKDAFETSPRRKLDMNDETKQFTLKQEILSLQKRLTDQFMVRAVFEKASGANSISHDTKDENPIVKPAIDLIKEISLLETQIVHLESYLLELYRKIFNFNQDSCLSTKDGSLKENYVGSSGNSKFIPKHACQDIWDDQKLSDSCIYRCHSSLSQRSIRVPSMNIACEAANSYHSLPLSMLQNARIGTNKHSTLASHLDSYTSENVLETPNRLSEEMVKCISSIYCKLADPGLTIYDQSSSTISMPQSMDELSDIFGNTSHLERSKEFIEPYCKMVEVQWICRDGKKLRETEPMLQSFRSMIFQLEEAYPRNMKHEEKLAFWINVHNALVMHAYLVYGIPKSNIRRMSLVLNAAYKIGGHTISVDMIQRSILGCRLPHPGQWLRLLFVPKRGFKAGDSRRLYAIEQQEPLLHFAVASGSYSDPVVRVYTPKRVYQELETAKKEYIKMNLQVHRSNKILLPKVVENYAKHSEMCHDRLMKMIRHFISDSLPKHIKHAQNGSFSKNIEWVPHNFTFRYLFIKELADS